MADTPLWLCSACHTINAYDAVTIRAMRFACPTCKSGLTRASAAEVAVAAALDLDAAVQKIGELAATLVKPPHLFIIVVTDKTIAHYRSNIADGTARLPEVFRELAGKLELPRA